MKNNEAGNRKIFIPDEVETDIALERATHLCFAAHQDDTEFMAYHAIKTCYDKDDEWFTSVIVTDGAGSPRIGKYAAFTDEDMKNIRVQEQNEAALIGHYGAQIQLGYSSRSVKANEKGIVDEIKEIITQCTPQIIYTHNLADKHSTHVATALRVIEAIRALPEDRKPEQLIGLEVWRSLDWVADKQKQVFDASANPALAQELMSVFDSQIAGGKRYDEAVMGRRKANATFLADHEVDRLGYAVYGIGMSALMHTTITYEQFISHLIDTFKHEVITTIKSLSEG